MQTFVDLHLRRFDAFRQAAHRLNTAFYVIQDITGIVVAFHFNLYVTPTFNSSALDFLNTRQIGDSIFKWNHDGFFHLLRCCTAVGDTDSNFIRIKVREHFDR